MKKSYVYSFQRNAVQITVLFVLLAWGLPGCNSKTNQGDSRLIHKDPLAGTKWNIFGVTITGKIMSTETNGDYSVIVSNTPPEGGPPLHVHQNEDELFFVLKGKFEFTCGDEKVIALKGSLIRLPRGIPHRFKNIGAEEGITMNTITPGGFENFFEEVAAMAKNGALNQQNVDSVASKYGLKFLR